MVSSAMLGKVLVWAIVLSMLASTVAIYASQNPNSIGWPPSSRGRIATPARADTPLNADVVGWVLGPGNMVRGLVVAWTPPEGSTYALRASLKDEAGGIMASASCKGNGTRGESRQDTIPFAMGPPLHSVSQVVITILEAVSAAPPCL
ncbi:MAG: hypothetical protein ACK4K2_05360 [Dehalococcoidia bacterium]